MEDDADLREQLFHNTVRENIVSKLNDNNNQHDILNFFFFLE